MVESLNRCRCNFTFPKFLDMLIPGFSGWNWTKFIYKISIIWINNDTIWVYITQYGLLLFLFPKIFVVLSGILSYRITQNIACDILILQDVIDIIFTSIKGLRALLSHFFGIFLKNEYVVFYWMKSHKNLNVRYTLLEITIIHFRCL